MRRDESGALTWSEVQLQELPQYMTTAVALITSGAANDYNVMAAEWTYLVARRPPHLAVCIQEANVTGDLVAESLEFGATLLTDSQTALADLAGHFSKTEVTKRTSALFTPAPSRFIEPPVIAGGLATFECRVTRIVPLPGYRLFIGEVLAAKTDPSQFLRPLIKHGGMYHLGQPTLTSQLAIAADITQGTTGAIVRIGGRVPHQMVGINHIRIWIDYIESPPDGPFEVSVDSRGYYYHILEIASTSRVKAVRGQVGSESSSALVTLV